MAGAYCKFCDQRCFVDRVMPSDSRWMPGKTVHLATCTKGAELDRQVAGYDFTTAINPYDLVADEYYPGAESPPRSREAATDAGQRR